MRESLKALSEDIKKKKVVDPEFFHGRSLMREDYEFYKPIRSRSIFAGDLHRKGGDLNE
jgi:hypothetical protein